MRTWRLQFLVVSIQQMSGLSIGLLKPAAWRLFRRDSQRRGAGVEEDAGEETLTEFPHVSRRKIAASPGVGPEDTEDNKLNEDGYESGGQNDRGTDDDQLSVWTL
jgi:hypothetical protein